ncbi:MAG TPA: MlaD family protein [Chitinophagaceae bacterium]|nr:MlaD family protein [Chitinophagaceae bacterium]
MKLSNETKIGALTAIAVTLLILGFNFLKGKSLFKTGNFLYAKFSDAKKLNPSDPVFIKGYQVGSVYSSEVKGADVSVIIVSIKLNSAYNIPVNSVASIDASPFSGQSIDITPGNSTTFLNSGDTIPTTNQAGLIASVTDKIAPIADQLKATLSSLDTVLRNVNTVLDPTTKGNLQSVIANLSKATANIVVTTADMQNVLNAETGSLSKSLDNIELFTKNLADNNDKITGVLSNLDSTTAHLSKADIEGIAGNLKASTAKLNELLSKLSADNNSVGALLNNKELYNNINTTINSLHILMDDLRVHPRRYVNVSVFGRKDKGNYLTSPLKDSTNTQAKP